MVKVLGETGGAKGVYEVMDTDALPHYLRPLALKPFRPNLPMTIYLPFDPNNPVLTAEPMDRWPYRDFKDSDGTVRAQYSPNLHKILLQYYTKEDETGKYLTALPFLIVDYGSPFRAQYYGTTKPPERDLSLQLDDWLHGYMLARQPMKSMTTKVTAVDPCGYRSPRFGCMPKKKEYTLVYHGGYYWVWYPARLVTLPPQVLTVERDVLIFTYERPGEADKAIVGKIIDYFEKRKLKEDVPIILNLLKAAGLELDPSLAYEYNGKIYRGIKVFVSGDGKSYEVYIPVRRATRGQVAPAVLALASRVILAIAVIGALLIIRDIAFAWKDVKLAQANVETEKIYIMKNLSEQLDSYMREIQELDIPDDQKAQLMKQVLDYYGTVITSLSHDPTGRTLFGDITKYLEYAAIGAAGLGLLWLGTKVVGAWRSASKS